MQTTHAAAYGRGILCVRKQGPCAAPQLPGSDLGLRENVVAPTPRAWNEVGRQPEPKRTPKCHFSVRNSGIMATVQLRDGCFMDG